MTTTQYPPATDLAGTVTVFVPLTTTFTAAPSCSTLFRQNGLSLVAYDPGYGLDIDTRAGGGRCAPGPVTTWWEQARLGINNDDGVHTAASLGPLTCPDGWATLASSQKDAKSTVAMCCPFGYHLENGRQGSIKGDCQSSVGSGTVLTYAATVYGTPSVWQTETTTLTAASFVGAIAVVGWNIAVEETQKTTTTAAATATGTSISTTPTLPQLSSDTNLQPQQSGSNSPSSSSSSPAESSNGTTIGASVGASLGVVALIMGAALLVVRRRRKRSRGEIGEFDALAPAPAGQPGREAELPVASLGRSRTNAIDRKRPSELSGASDQRTVVELDG